MTPRETTAAQIDAAAADQIALADQADAEALLKLASLDPQLVKWDTLALAKLTVGRYVEAA